MYTYTYVHVHIYTMYIHVHVHTYVCCIIYIYMYDKYRHTIRFVRFVRFQLGSYRVDSVPTGKRPHRKILSYLQIGH